MWFLWVCVLYTHYTFLYTTWMILFSWFQLRCQTASPHKCNAMSVTKLYLNSQVTGLSESKCEENRHLVIVNLLQTRVEYYNDPHFPGATRFEERQVADFLSLIKACFYNRTHSEFPDAVQSSVVEQFGHHRTLYRGGSVYCTNLFSAIYKSVHPIPVRSRPKLYKTIMSRFYAKSAYRASVFVGRNDNQ